MNDFLFSPTKQFLFPSGKILAGGKIYVFIKHTDNLATLYNDEDIEIANPVILDSNGRATVKADDTYDYKLDVYSPYDELLFTATSYLTDNFERDFAITSTDGSVDVNVSIDGYTTNWDLSVTGAVSGKFDTSAFESFYNDTYGPTVGDIYHKIDDISATVSGGYDSKLDVTAFNLYSAGVRGELNVITGNTAALSNNTAMLSDEIIQNMNDINAVSGGLNTLNTIVIPDIRSDIAEVSSKVDTVSSSITNKLDTTAFNDFISNSYSTNMSTIYQGLSNLSANKEDKITWSYNNDGEISAANGSALAGKGYYSKYAPYGIQATSGNLVIEGSRYPHQSLLEVSGENKVATAGIIPPVPEQNLSAVRYLVAASGSLADVEWKELPQIDTFSGVTTDSTLTGNGKDTPLGVAEVQTLSSDESISITSANNEVILGVNSSWFDNAVNSAYTGTTYSSVSGTVQVSGNDLEIWNTGLRRDIKWDTDVWIHEDGTVTAGNGGWGASPNRTYRLTHVMTAGQYTNPAHPGFSAELRQEDENYNVLSSTMIYGIFNPYEFTTVPGCVQCSLYYSGTTDELDRGVSVLTSNYNYYTFTDDFAWKTDVPTKTDFANLYENIAVNSGNWGGGTSIDFHYIEV